MTAPRADEGPVLDAFRAGDETALADLYARWSPLVYSLALRSLGDVGAAEQVTQGVFTQAWTSRDAFDPARTRLSDWLVGLACDRIAEVREAPDRESPLPAGTNIDNSARSESKSGVLAERLLVADDMSHLGVLPQRLLRMALDRHLTLTEIAERTGFPVEEVRSEVVRGLTELRLRLKEEDPDAPIPRSAGSARPR